MTATEFRSETIRVVDHDVPIQIGGTGPPLVLLHGGGGAGVVGSFEGALARSFTVYAPAAPGFAGSPLPDWVRGVHDVALHTLDLLDGLGLERPTLVGQSLGGWIATEMAVFRPAALARLVLVSPIGVRTAAPMPDLFIMEPAEAMSYLFADLSNAAALAPSGAPDVDAIVRMFEERAASARLTWKRSYDPGLERRLHMITCPTLLVWGSEDRLVPRSHGDKLVKAIPDCRLETVPKAGHVVAIEAPEVLAGAIARFARESA